MPIPTPTINVHKPLNLCTAHWTLKQLSLKPTRANPERVKGNDEHASALRISTAREESTIEPASQGIVESGKEQYHTQLEK